MTSSLDVRDAAQWKALVERVVTRWGRLDILLNVAGVLRPGYVDVISDADVHLQIDVNVKGVMFGTQTAAAQMVKQRAGHIINVASLAGVAPVPGLSVYSASKFAVRGFSLSAAIELRDKGVHVSLVCPDAVQTPMLDDEQGHEEAALAFSGAEQPLTVHDISRVVFEEVLPHAPLERIVPPIRGRMAKLGSAFPAASLLLMGLLRSRGLKNQQKRPR